MGENDQQKSRSAQDTTALRLAVHLDAFVESPREYLRASWWWITGKKLRARMQWAPLLAQSPRAYRLWQRQVEQRDNAQPPPPQDGPTIRALVANGDGLEATLFSCESEGVPFNVIEDAKDLSQFTHAKGEWALPVRAGDRLATGAIAHYRSLAASVGGTTQIIYADDDLICETSDHEKPHLKPDWNSELFRFHDYISGSALFRAEALSQPTNAQDDWIEALTTQAIEVCREVGGQPVHIPRVLHHRRERPVPRLPLPSAATFEDGKKAPSVSVIVPTRNRLDLLRVCIEGVLSTQFPGELEVIVIDNGSDDPATLDYLRKLGEASVRVLHDDGPFDFAALNNRAVDHATGDLLCFLNNDIEITQPDWLSILAHQAMREDVGAVGARLLYPTGLIQHAGVVTGIGGAAAHAHRGLHPDEEGYFHRHRLPQFVSAVTAACMVISREKFDAVGGFDAERFAVSFNDVDLCLRLREKGWHTVYEPRATLVHHESVSRGFDRDPAGAARQARETRALQERWHTGFASSEEKPKSADPYHHPGLSPLSERFALRL
ncbi:MAG: glycosyltransferase family 2 protein [Pseudomonadota bacterium]